METELERRSSKRSVDGLQRSGSDFSESAGRTGLTNYIGETNLDWEPPAEEPITKKERGISFRKALRTTSFRKKDEAKLPKNWKRDKEKDGSACYVNSVTNKRSVEFPPELPAGWTESLHKESRRVCYTNKALQKTTFEFPAALEMEAPPDENSELAREPTAKDSLFSRTVSIFAGKKSVKKADGEVSERNSSFRRRSVASKGDRSSVASAGAGAPAQSQRTVFISCSALIRETKLCVGRELQEPLDKLLTTLAAREILAELAVKQLMELVGSTIVQQAGLSVMNAQKGVLPHGWLEYVDEASGRPYYYNVHTRETTWYKPKPPEKPMAVDHSEGDEGFVNLETNVETHNIAISAEI